MEGKPRVLCLQVATCIRGFRSAVALKKLGYHVTLVYHGVGESARLIDRSVLDRVIDMNDPRIRGRIGWGPLRYPLFLRVLGESRGRMVFSNLLSVFPSAIGRLLKEIDREGDLYFVQISNYPDGPVKVAKDATGRICVMDVRDITTGISVQSLRSSYDNAILCSMGLDRMLARWHFRRWARLERDAALSCDGVIYSTEEMRCFFEGKYPILRKRPSTVIENRPFTEELAAGSLVEAPASGAVPRLVYVGAVSRRGYRDFTDVFKAIAVKGYELHLYIISPEEVRSYYRDVLDGHPNVIFHEALPPKDLYAQLPHYDYGLVPFRLDVDPTHVKLALPNKLFDYLACGLRVITTEMTSTKRFLGMHDVGFTYRGPDDLLISLERDWAEAGKHGRRALRQEFTYDSHMEDLKRFYESLLG